MRIRGEAVLHAPVEEVYRALNDPAVLVRTIPGCERLEQVGEDRYRMTVTAGVASIKGTYQGDVALTAQEPPRSFVLAASGAGAPGTVSADVTVTLAEADGDGTRLEYDAEAVVGGMIGGVGQRVLAGVAKKTAGEFFRAVDGVLTGTALAPAGAGAAAPAGAPAGASAGPPAATEGAAAPAWSAPGAGAAPAVAGGGPLVAAAVGAAIALTGVALGWALARAAARR